MTRLTGTRSLLRLVARRERLRFPVYVAVLALLIGSTAVQSEALYPTQAEREEYAASMASNPGMLALVGPVHAVDTVGGDVAWQWGAFGAVVAALMSMFVLGRHTRAEEQSGRSELVLASVAGRFAPTAAALAAAVTASLLTAATVALTMLATGQPAEGSLAFGASLGGVGLAFAGVALVAMQLSQTTAGAYGLTGAALGLAYLLRGAGDVGDGTLSWLSPIGWGQAMRPYADERWWPLALLLALALATCALGFWLLARRDDGAGVVAPRPGSPSASLALTRPLGFALRLHRAALAGWAAGLFLSGVMIGLVGEDADSVLGDSETVDDLFRQASGSLVDNYLAVSLASMALVGTGFALQAMVRLRAEETSGRLEPLLATALSRPRWAASHLALAALGSAAVLAATGLGTGIADAIVSDDASRLPLLIGSALAYVPAVWALTGLALALFGLVPRATQAVWGALAACFLVMLLGPLLSLPDWVIDVSPYSHVPLLPAADFDVVPLAALTAVAAGLAAIGLAGFRRRDLSA